jgi:hypothetical protein
VALGAEHACPQLPQLLTSVLRFRHTPLHMVWPVGQPWTHTPLEQIVPAGHCVSLIQPLHTPVPSHVPVGQAVPAGELTTPQVPFTHVAAWQELLGVGQSAAEVQPEVVLVHVPAPSHVPVGQAVPAGRGVKPQVPP